MTSCAPSGARAGRRPTPAEPVIVAGLTKSFGGASVLRGVDLSVPAGALVAILGRSGCGKTTLLRCVAGLERPDAGS
ncbi:MAG: ATP-binding cassette domain-containing protein, partial [Thermoleophilia bacterium]|nr:ATP-binding cassette domain-containing protein [Thermoleophilia bacterium]